VALSSSGTFGALASATVREEPLFGSYPRLWPLRADYPGATARISSNWKRQVF
jgi:hypothetical protein